MPPIDGQQIQRRPKAKKKKKREVYGPPAPKPKNVFTTSPFHRPFEPVKKAAPRRVAPPPPKAKPRSRPAPKAEPKKRTTPNVFETTPFGPKGRQLGLDNRVRRAPAIEPPKAKAKTYTVAGPRGQTITRTTSKPTSETLKTAYRAIGRPQQTKHEGKVTPVQAGLMGALPAMHLAALVGGIPRKLVQNTAKDVYQAPAQVVPSAVQTASAIDQAVRKGNLKPGKALLSEADKTDPVWNTLVAGANLIKGDTKGASKRLKAAGKAAEEHPGLTALEIFATKGALGRGVTRTGAGTARVAESRVAARVAPKAAAKTAKRARAISSTERAPARLPNTNLVVHRQHTRDAFQRYANRKRDQQKRDRATYLRDLADDTGDKRKALEFRDQARKVDPDLIKGRQIRQAVNEHVDASEQIRRRGRLDALRDVKRETKGAKKGGPIVSLLTQRITKADLPSLKEYRDRIEQEGKDLPPEEKAKILANDTLVRDLTQAIKDVEAGKVDLQHLDRIADAYAERSRAGQQELIDRGLLDPAQAERAALIPHAAAQMGARNDPQTLQAAAVLAGKQAQKAKGKAQTATNRRIRRSERNKAQAEKEPVAVAKREASMASPSRKHNVVDYLKRVERMDPDELAAELKREQERERKLDKRTSEETTAKATARGAKKTAAKAKETARFNPVLRNGETLTNKAIRKSLGGKSAAFLTQAPGMRGARNFFRGSEKAPSIDSAQRTHKATVEGTFDADPEVLREQAAHTQGLVDAFDNFKRGIHRFAYRETGPQTADGRPMTKKTFKEAQQKARDLEADGRGEWVPIRTQPLNADARQKEAMLNPAASSERSLTEFIQNATKSTGDDDPGPWAIVPKEMADQMAKHMKTLAPNDLGRAWRQGTSVFRKAVLTTSPPWLAGNVSEGTLRAVLNQAGPRSWATGRRVRKDATTLDAANALRGEAQTIGTGRMALADRNDLHSELSQYSSDFAHKVGRIPGAVLRAETKGGLPLPPKAVKSLWDIYTHTVSNIINRGIENQFQNAMLGKAIRNQRAGAGKRQVALRPKALMTDHAQQLSAKAVEDAAKGILDENTAAALGREIDRMYGKYAKFSPEMRTAMAYYTPFIAWTLNAAKFVARLPHDHPAFTAMTAAMQQQSEEWRKDQGLDMWLGEGGLPDWLQGSIPDKAGGHYRAPTRYTPFGLGTDLPGTVAKTFLPQISGVLSALNGQDWKGDKLKDADGKEIKGAERWPAAAGAYLDSTIPFLSMYKRIKKKGADQTLIKGTLGYVPKTTPKGAGQAVDDDPFGDGFDENDFDDRSDAEFDESDFSDIE